MKNIHAEKSLARLSVLTAVFVAQFCSAVVAQPAASQIAQVPSLAPQSTIDRTSKLSPTARQLAEQLNVLELINKLANKQKEYEEKGDIRNLVEAMEARQKLLMQMQHAALEIEEALAGIDGDISTTNMHLSYINSRREKSLMLTNLATFVGSGTFGLLDSATSIKSPAPTPQVFGIISNSIATGLPILSLRRQQYEVPRRSQGTPNSLAPMFGRPYDEKTFDPLVWNYIESGSPGLSNNLTRREQLLSRWRDYRGIHPAGGASNQQNIDLLIGAQKPGTRLTPDLLKTRSELLLDLRSLVQMMYRDISELSAIVVGL